MLPERRSFRPVCRPCNRLGSGASNYKGNALALWMGTQRHYLQTAAQTRLSSRRDSPPDDDPTGVQPPFTTWRLLLSSLGREAAERLGKWAGRKRTAKTYRWHCEREIVTK